MNTDHPSPEDQKWHALLGRSSATFAGDTTPPFGFVTSTLARLKAERKERDLLEFIGLRALFTSLADLVAVAGFSVGVQLQDRLDFDPGIKSLIQADDVPIS